LDPIAFKTKLDSDTIYNHEEMNSDDRERFIEAMDLEIDAHSDNEDWELMKRRNMPAHHKILSALYLKYVE
jgi:hypothetical protein